MTDSRTPKCRKQNEKQRVYCTGYHFAGKRHKKTDNSQIARRKERKKREKKSPVSEARHLGEESIGGNRKRIDRSCPECIWSREEEMFLCCFCPFDLI